MDKIDKFKQSQDYKDICYMIDHVSNLEVRKSVLNDLGYKIGVDIIKKDFGVKNVVLGKRNEIRIQISPKFPSINIANSVIIE